MIGLKIPDFLLDGNKKGSLGVTENLLPGEDDQSPEAQERKNKVMLRAVYAEFLGTILFFLPIFALLANNQQDGYGGSFNRLTAGVVQAMSLMGMIFCFSGLSGAIFNPAIVFALWLVGKLSNRKCIWFILVQMLASVICMLLIWGSFPHVHQDTWEALVVRPIDDATDWTVFFSEFLTTFILTFTAFAMAFEEAESVKSGTMSIQASQASDGLVVYGSTPQSKLGFAPFALGFVIMALSQYGGGCGGPAMNPVRMFGPAIMSGIWDSFFLYMLGQFLGAGAAGLLVAHGPQSGERAAPPSDRPRASTRLSMVTAPISMPSST